MCVEAFRFARQIGAFILPDHHYLWAMYRGRDEERKIHCECEQLYSIVLI